jgi:signal transduction histidine kinase
MDQQDESGPGERPTAAPAEAQAQARAGEQATVSTSVSATVAGSGSRDAIGRNGGAPPGAGGVDQPRVGGGFFARVVSRATGPRMAGRLLAAGDAERERIEQDIHDGVQQHLTALRIRLGLAAESFQARGDTEAGAVLAGFGEDVEHVIDEVRDIAQGIYPALLTSTGLSAALASACRRAGQSVTVQAGGVRRCRPEVEIAVYFSCLAAIDNAAKHAGPGQVSICLSDTGDALRFAVCDSGAGFDPDQTPTGTGITNMRDRIAAVGGTLTLYSTPGRGTRVEGSVPDPWQHATPT